MQAVMPRRKTKLDGPAGIVKSSDRHHSLVESGVRLTLCNQQHLFGVTLLEGEGYSSLSSLQELQRRGVACASAYRVSW